MHYRIALIIILTYTVPQCKNYYYWAKNNFNQSVIAIKTLPS